MLYDTTDPFDWHTEFALAPGGVHGTITDIDFAQAPREGLDFVFSSLNLTVHAVRDRVDSELVLPIGDGLLQPRPGAGLGVLSVKLSAGGNELVAGTTEGFLCLYRLRP